MQGQTQQNKLNNGAPRPRVRFSQQTRLMMILLTLLLSAAAGLIGLLYSSNYAPLFVGMAIAAPVLLVFFIYKPEWSLYLGIVIVFLPLGLIPAEIQSYANRGSVVLVFAAWFVHAILYRKKVNLPSATIIFLGFIMWGMLSLIWTERFDVSLTILQAYILRWVFFLFLAVNIIDTKEKLNGLMNTLAFLGIVMIVGSIVEFAVNGYDPNARFTILGMNENEVGIMFLTALIGVLWWAKQPSARFAGTKKLLSALFLLVTIAMVALSGSRGSAISLVVAIFCFGFFKATRYWAWVTVLIIIIGLLATPFIFSTVLERFDSSGIKGDTTLGGREGLWQAGWLVIRDNLWLGVGIGNADYALVPYLSDPSVPMITLPTQVWGMESDSLHNPVLTVFADTGIVGIALYLGTILAAVLSFVKAYRTCQIPAMKLYYALVVSIYLGYQFSWIKGGGVQIGHTHFLMLTLLALPACTIADRDQSEEEQTPT